MSTSSPTYCFTIPSIHDGTPLDCRIYHSPRKSGLHQDHPEAAGFSISRKCAVLAHPYAPLGGCMDDPVVLLLVEQLLALDFVVCAFNFRGAETSKGNTSWTGKGEREDYMSVVGHLIFYISQLSSIQEHDPSTGELDQTDRSAEPSPEEINLLLGGYSYGSLILSRLPSTQDIISHFHPSQPTLPITEILLRAKTLAERTNLALAAAQTHTRGRLSQETETNVKRHRKSNSHHSITYGGSETSSPARKRSSTDVVRRSTELPNRLKQAMRRNSKRPMLNHQQRSSSSAFNEAHTVSDETPKLGSNLPHISTCYLLISPLLPPLSNMLSFQATSLQFWRQAPAPDHLVRNPTLVVFGTEDIFTSATKLEGWCGRMHELASRNTISFDWNLVHGASHFWRESGVQRALGDAVVGWIREVVAPVER